MEKMSLWLEEKLLPIGMKVNNIKFLRVIRGSMMPTIPFIIIGSIVLIILNFPFIEKVMPAVILTFLSDLLSPLTRTTMSLVGMFLAFLMGYNYVKETQETKANPVYCGLTTLIGFFCVTPFEILVGEEVVNGVIPTSYMGSSGMFIAIVVGYIVAMFYCKMFDRGLTIKLPDSVPPAILSSFEAIIPATISLLLPCVLNYLLSLTSFGNVYTAFTTLLAIPLLAIGTSLPALLIMQAAAQLLWFVGIHGDQIVGSVVGPILNNANLQNYEAYMAGTPRPYIVTYQMTEIFIQIAFISLVIAVIIVAKSKRMKSTGKLAVVPAMFCISEPIVFGLPVIMNVSLFIPWILVRPIFGLITYLFMYFGLCPYPTGVTLPWTTPPLLSGFLITESIMGAVVQLICLVVGVFLFLPFVKMIDKKFRQEEDEGLVEE